MYSFSSHDSRLLVQENPPDLTVPFLAHGIIYCAFLSFFRFHYISHILSCVMTGLLWVHCTGPGVWTQAWHPQSWDGPGLRLFFNCPTGRWSSECSENMLQWLGKKNEKTKYHKETRLANKMHPRLLTPVDVFGTCGNAADSGGWSLCAAAFKVHLFFPFAEPFSKTQWKLHPSSVEGCMQEYEQIVYVKTVRVSKEIRTTSIFLLILFWNTERRPTTSALDVRMQMER